jgi:hypothetical protein
VEREMESVVEKLLLAGLILGATWYTNWKLAAFKHDLLTRVNARKFLFEKEMEFYQFFFKLITDLRNPLVAFTASFQQSPRDQTRVEWEQQYGSEFRKAFHELFITSMSYRPFFPENIYAEVDILLKTCNKRLRWHESMVSEMIDERKNAPDPVQFRQVTALSQNILEMTDGVIKLMRSRIDSFRGE